MKIATLENGAPDGRLVLVSDERAAVTEVAQFETLQQALEKWDEAYPKLVRMAETLGSRASGVEIPLSEAAFKAPLPRAWQWLDASTYLTHSALIEKAYNIPNPQRDLPLMYQGLSHEFFSHDADVFFPSEDDGIDFEGEFGVITDFVPMGVSPDEAMHHIKLIIQINDWSLRILGALEMASGFGFVRSKPPCSVAPYAVTPDELGDLWRDGRVHLPLHIHWNGKEFGRANGGEMAFGFHELIAHAATTRSLCPGTIIGSGTVSNSNYLEVGSSCIAERRGIEVIEQTKAQTSFLRFGDRVAMRAELADRSAPFGVIDQQVMQARSR